MSRKELIADIKLNSSIEHSFQRQPYSMVELCYEHNKLFYSGVGFSKVCHPDEWSEELGAAIARNRAVSEIYRQIHNV